MPVEIVEVDMKVAGAAKLPQIEKNKSVLAAAQRLHTDNWIAERVAAAVEAELANGSLPA